MSILVINAGSSGVKLTLFEPTTLTPIAHGWFRWSSGIGDSSRVAIHLTSTAGDTVAEEYEAADYRDAVLRALELLQQPGFLSDDAWRVRAVGHRLIHGGEDIRRPVLIDEAMKRRIAQFTHLAPLHIPAGLEAISASEAAFPIVPQAGVFDTSFFADIPPSAFVYPLPYAWYEEWGIRRLGYHGTSHAYSTSRVAELLDDRYPSRRIVICHLGQGSSAAAVRDGTAVMNTLGFTSLEGLPMGTRCGTIDPGVLLHVQRQHGLSADELEAILFKQSGLLGVSGVSADYRKIEDAADSGNARARLALEILIDRVRATIGSLAVTLGGVDVLVFTGGIGENASRLRAEVCQGLECLGLHLDPEKNDSCRPDSDIAAKDSSGRILVIHAREDYMIARETQRLSLG